MTSFREWPAFVDARLRVAGLVEVVNDGMNEKRVWRRMTACGFRGAGIIRQSGLLNP